MNSIDTGSIYAAIDVADNIIKLVKGIKDTHIAGTLTTKANEITSAVEQYTGTKLEQLRLERDQISDETHRIITEEIAKTPLP